MCIICHFASRPTDLNVGLHQSPRNLPSAESPNMFSLYNQGHWGSTNKGIPLKGRAQIKHNAIHHLPGLARVAARDDDIDKDCPIMDLGESPALIKRSVLFRDASVSIADYDRSHGGVFCVDADEA